MNKKFICILLCASILISIGGCSPMSESMKAIEGKDGGAWVLLDFYPVIVHFVGAPALAN